MAQRGVAQRGAAWMERPGGMDVWSTQLSGGVEGEPQIKPVTCPAPEPAPALYRDRCLGGLLAAHASRLPLTRPLHVLCAAIALGLVLVSVRFLSTVAFQLENIISLASLAPY